MKSLKVSLKHKTYKVSCPSTFRELIDKFNSKFRREMFEHSEIQYQDSAGDFILVSCEEDFQLALELHKNSKLKLMVRPMSERTSSSEDNFCLGNICEYDGRIKEALDFYSNSRDEANSPNKSMSSFSDSSCQFSSFFNTTMKFCGLIKDPNKSESDKKPSQSIFGLLELLILLKIRELVL